MLDVVITKNILNSEQLTMCVGDVVGCCGGVNFLIKKVYVLLGGGGGGWQGVHVHTYVYVLSHHFRRGQIGWGGEGGKVYVHTYMYVLSHHFGRGQISLYSRPICQYWWHLRWNWLLACMCVYRSVAISTAKSVVCIAFTHITYIA